MSDSDKVISNALAFEVGGATMKEMVLFYLKGMKMAWATMPDDINDSTEADKAIVPELFALLESQVVLLSLPDYHAVLKSVHSQEKKASDAK